MTDRKLFHFMFLYAPEHFLCLFGIHTARANFVFIWNDIDWGNIKCCAKWKRKSIFISEKFYYIIERCNLDLLVSRIQNFNPNTFCNVKEVKTETRSFYKYRDYMNNYPIKNDILRILCTSSFPS